MSSLVGHLVEEYLEWSGRWDGQLDGMRRLGQLDGVSRLDDQISSTLMSCSKFILYRITLMKLKIFNF